MEGWSKVGYPVERSERTCTTRRCTHDEPAAGSSSITLRGVSAAVIPSKPVLFRQYNLRQSARRGHVPQEKYRQTCNRLSQWRTGDGLGSLLMPTKRQS